MRMFWICASSGASSGSITAASARIHDQRIAARDQHIGHFSMQAQVVD
jgi:hypothetical protein